MKVFTKAVLKNLELYDLYDALNSKEKHFMPVLFFNGEHEGVAKSAITTVKTHFNLADIENQISFIILPANIPFLNNFVDETDQNEYSPQKDFLYEYTNRLRIISELPNAFVKTARAFMIMEKSHNDSIVACAGLTIEDQFGEKNYIYSIVELFDETTITNAYKIKDNIFIELDKEIKIVLIDAEIIEEEKSPINAYVEFFELHKIQGRYELHFLLMIKDSNLIENFHYVTYRFGDMRFLI